MSAVGSLNALCPALGFILGGTIAALSSPRVAMLVAGAVATLATFAFMRLPIGDLRASSEAATSIATEPELAASHQ